MDWSKQIAIVTGGGRGIGAATVRHLNLLGAKVMMTARTATELESVQRSCTKPENVLWEAGDIGDPSVIERVFSASRKKWGPLTILFNNAATISVVEFPKVSAELLNKTLDVNVVAPFVCSQLAFAQMRESGLGGAIINMSSLAGLIGTDKFNGFSTYCVSKFAIVGLTEASAVEGKPYGIRVNCIAPGAVNTKMLKDNAPQLKSRTYPEDIAKLVVFLADATQSGALTGSVIPVMSNVSE
jgi:3-oxoacyl-[acyl-carrier protein] reductase